MKIKIPKWAIKYQKLQRKSKFQCGDIVFIDRDKNDLLRPGLLLGIGVIVEVQKESLADYSIDFGPNTCGYSAWYPDSSITLLKTKN